MSPHQVGVGIHDRMIDALPDPGDAPRMVITCSHGAALVNSRGVGSISNAGASGPTVRTVWAIKLAIVIIAGAMSRLVRGALSGLPVQEAAQLVGGNAVDVYGFDRALLESVAERVCPPDEELVGAA